VYRSEGGAEFVRAIISFPDEVDGLV